MVAQLVVHHGHVGYGLLPDQRTWTVMCDDCHIALNSGHHYTAAARHIAAAMARDHNEHVHNMKE